MAKPAKRKSPGPWRQWTPKEDGLVRQLPPAEVARRTGRTLYGVYHRRYVLGITSGPPRRAPKAAPRADA